MKSKKEVRELFLYKYNYLKSIYTSVGEFDESAIYQTPDGGWQLNLTSLAAITLRPNDEEPHETHGGICQRWYKEGGAFDEHRKRGWLGFPISDEEVYEGDGDQNDRVSHFENGDIILTAKNNETRIVKKMKNSALTTKRQEIIKPLDGLRDFVKRPINGLTDSRVKDMEKAIDSAEHSICYDRYRVTVFGAFSSGKSTLLNALMGADYLPAANLATTNIATEIFRSDRYYIFMPGSDFTDAQIKAVRNEVSDEISGGMFLAGLKRDGQTIPGVGVVFQGNDPEEYCRVIATLADEQSCRKGLSRFKKGLSRFKKLIKGGSSTALQLGIPNLPEWLGEITLTDAPGAGSDYEAHEFIINDIIPKTQLVLYVVDSTKVGSATDKQLFCNRILNCYHRKVFFILNQIDQLNSDEIADALAELREHLPSVKAGIGGESSPPRPEFLKTSALCESLANRLLDGSLTTNDLRGIKVPLQDLTWSDEWRNARSEEERKNLAIRFLREQSQFDKLRERIKSYLHEENKELPFCEMAAELVTTCGQELGKVCKKKIVVLREDRSVKELEEKQKELRRQRERNAKEARSALNDYRESALRPGTGVVSKVEDDLAKIPDAVVGKLEKVLQDNGEFDRLMANKCAELNKWLSVNTDREIMKVSQKLGAELHRRGEHLICRLKPILERIDDATLELPIDETSESPEKLLETGNDTGKVNPVVPVVAGATGSAVAAVIGVAMGAGTGLAGLASSLGFGSLASTLATLGLGSVALPLGPIIVIAGVVTAIIAFLFGGPRRPSRKDILNNARTKLTELILGSKDDSILNKYKAMVDEFVNKNVVKCEDNLKSYLAKLDEQEKTIIADAVKSRNDKEEKIKELDAFVKEVRAFVVSSVQTLRELNSGKEPAHV